MARVLEVEHLSVDYCTAHGSVRAVEDVSFDVLEGEIFGLAGESGSGKSTVAQAILRVLGPPAVIRRGRVSLGERDLLRLAPEALRQLRFREISMVFQSAMSSLNPLLTVGAHLSELLQTHHYPGSRSDRARELLKLVELDARLLSAYPHQLSGGMRQRVGIALALALAPRLVILDEPTTALDVLVQREILERVKTLQRELGFSVLFITHDLSLLFEIAHRIAVMYAGRLVEVSPAEVLRDGALHPYSAGLVAAFPALDAPRERLEGIAGSPPLAGKRPSGCAFHPRCREARALCREQEPRLSTLRTSVVACHARP